jgi:hypothetical protein
MTSKDRLIHKMGGSGSGYNQGGEAMRQWHDNPGAMWAPPRTAPLKPRPIAKATANTTRPIPNSGPMPRAIRT